MTPLADAPLLRDFARTGSERAFGELVSRHTNLVYSAALRQTGCPELAREITQDVFTDLARKAPTLAEKMHDDATLGGWLYTSTRYLSLNALRDERRRVAREQKLMPHEDSTPAPDAWAAVAPVLDEAMAELNDAERESVVLRFFNNLDFHAVGRALGVSDDTAQKRVTRAIEHLRELLAKRGVTVGGSGLVILISTNAVLVAPVGLSAAIITGAVAAIATSAVTQATIITMSWINAKSVAAMIAAAFIAGTATYFVEEHRVNDAEARARQLLEQQSQLATARDEALAMARTKAQEAARPRTDANDLARLRNEVTQLRQQLAAQQSRTLQAAAPPNEAPKVVAHTPGSYIAKEQMGHVGFATPEAGLETITFALMNGTYEQTIEAMGDIFAKSERENPNGSEEFAARQKKIAPHFKGMQIVAKKVLADDKVELKYRWDFAPEFLQLNPGLTPPEFQTQPMLRIGTEWRMGGSTRDHQRDWDVGGQIQTFTP